jgi:xanthine dehydrogenase accessory factor
VLDVERILTETIRLLDKGESVVWATVVDQQGSAPRSAGSRMLVRKNGENLGSVGGGRLEAETLEVAAPLMENPGQRLLQFSLSGKDVAETDMICGGQALIFVETLLPEAASLLKELRNRLIKGKEVLWVTLLDEGARSCEEGHLLLEKDGDAAGKLNLDQRRFTELESLLGKGRSALIPLSPGTEAIYVEPMKRSPYLYIFGGGHISLDLAWFADRIDFQIIVIDDREDFANRERFPMAVDLEVGPFEGVLNKLDFGPEDYVVIVTRGHLHDMTVLREVLKQSPRYVGMIGSRRKKALIFEQLMKEGVSSERLDQIHAPIGIHIHAETPAEIAVSIVAELIQARAGADERKLKTWKV